MDHFQIKRRKHTGTTSAWFGPMAFVLICFSIIMAMSIFFRVTKIEVQGNMDYTDEQIVDATGIDKGDNLFFLNRIGACSRLMARLPYLQEARIARVLPNKVIITVSESNAVAMVSSETSNWMIDRDCKLMTPVTESESMGLIQVLGITAHLPAVGDTIQTEDGDEETLSYLCEILTEIEVRGLQSKIADLDMSDPGCPKFVFEDRFNVKFGPQGDTIHKFGMLLSAVSQLAPGDMGVIDLSIDDKAHFLQY